MAVETLGILGGIITNSAILPQIYKSYRTQSTRDLSWAMFLTYYAGILMMLTYGILITEPAIIVSTCYSILTNTLLVLMKCYFELYGATPSPGMAPHPDPDGVPMIPKNDHDGSSQPRVP